MTDDISKLGRQTADEIAKTLIAEIVKKVSIEDGDILVVKVASEEVFTQLQSIMATQTGKKFLLVNQDYADILREIDEDEMRELGWVRAGVQVQVSQETFGVEILENMAKESEENEHS